MKIESRRHEHRAGKAKTKKGAGTEKMENQRGYRGTGLIKNQRCYKRCYREMKRKHIFGLLSFSSSLVIPLVILCTSVSPVKASWNDQWSYCKKISLSPSGMDMKEGAEQAVILLKLHSGNLDFTKVKEDGSDLRFVSSDNKTLLKHHLEKFDSLDELAWVWVQLPGLSGGLTGASGQNYIWMYYGNKDAETGEDAKGTYDVNQVAIYHLGETETQGPPKDQTTNANDMTEFTGTKGLAAVVGDGVSLNGIADKMVIPNSSSLNFSGGCTFSVWVKITGNQKDASIFSREEGNRGMVIGINQARIFVRLSTGQGEEQVTMVEAKTDLSLDTWHQVAATIDQNRKLTLYLDGTVSSTKDLHEALPEMTSNIVIGASAGGRHFLAADLDEIQISNQARPEAWLRLTAESQVPESALCLYGEEEKNVSEGWLAYKFHEYLQYTKTTMRVTSLDGWFFNILIMILLIMSWYVLVSKVITLKIVDRDNKAFQRTFKEVKDPFSLEDAGQEFQNSSLYPVYLAGKQELNKRFDNSDPDQSEKKLTSKGLNTLKTALEKESTAQEQKLNKWLMILTLSISGGPFLGLLGTVYGIMNTFAAITQTGEADMLVIAPGIASAISTTVLGLIVGIPALFSYNYLVARIKDMTIDGYLLIDELICNADEKYGES